MALGHLQHLQSLLAGVTSAAAAAETKAKSCRNALEMALAASVLADQEWHTLVRSQAGLQQAITEARRAVRYTLLLPSEILSLIFAHAAAWDRDAGDPVDWDAVTLPGCLRLVCKRWDSISLSTQALWTYIAVPATVEFTTRAGVPEYLALQLGRSGSLPLNVVISADFAYPVGQARNAAIVQQGHFLRKAFDVLVTEQTVARIRILKVYGGPPALDEPVPSGYWSDLNNICDLTLGMLRLPTPLLEEAALIMDPDIPDQDEPWQTASENPLPLYLPVAPNLRSLRIVQFPLLCCPTHPGFPVLGSLAYTFKIVREDHLLAMFSLCPALRELDSSIEELDNNVRPHLPNRAPSLFQCTPLTSTGESAAAPSSTKSVCPM
ncbi:hypothetical protein AURDEDRAFT_169737 [Auricularia subglabra TFB-10046 SS5]|nr:hypothetical protein AURDEDRAFT_169737 [Auricularia subglabra TFB-10046 SS5]